jgi:arginase family enzyme
MPPDSEQAAVVVFPFDLFGSSGTGEGAALLADELREVLADNRRERVPTRASAYTERLRLREISWETLNDLQHWRDRGRQAVRQVLARKDFLLWLSGNHLGVLPLYDALSGSGPQTLVVQLDAHLDIHHFTTCTRELSHGNFLLHCAGPLPPIVNVGHRELLLTPDHVAAHYRQTFPAERLAATPAPVLKQLRAAARQAQRVFLDIDCDVFDPAYFPAVSRAVPFGLTPHQVLSVLDAAWGKNVAGVALSEFDPARDDRDRSLATLVWLLEHLLLKRYEKMTR